MFVVNTTSATVVVRLARRAPRNRVPSSRRRNPGTTSRSATVLGLLGRWRRRRRLPGGRSLRRRGGCGRSGGQRDACGTTARRAGSRSGRDRRRLRERLIEHRLGSALARRRDREDERQEEEQRSAPPARLGQQVARLARAEEGIGGAAHATKARGETVALPALKQDGGDQHEAVDDEQNEEESEHAAVRAGETSRYVNLKYAGTSALRSSERVHALQMPAQPSGSRLAPPTSNPSTAGAASSVAALPTLTLPPYRIGTASIAFPPIERSSARIA